tara:strand:+ start:1297 stop:2568 length:1272 start_codon:yes stop_codon:yes gene_type:complete
MASAGDLNKSDGDILFAADITALLNSQSSIFNDVAQNLFEADYNGFDSRLAGTGTPNLKNVFYSTFKTDDADTVLNMTYDSTNDYYYTPDLSSSNLVYVDIYATSVNTTTLSDVANEVYCFQIGTNVWRIYANGSNKNENINRIFTKLFDGLANGASDPNGVTSLTQLRISETDYQDTKVRYVSWDCDSGTGASTDYLENNLEMTFSSSGTVKLVASYGLVTRTSGGWEADLEAPDGTSLEFIRTGSSYTPSFDHRASSTIHSATTTTATHQFRNYAGGSGRSGYLRAVYVYDSGVTFSSTTAADTGNGLTTSSDISSAISISSSAPDTSTYPVGTSTLIFKDTTSSATTNAIPAINYSANASNTVTIQLSADGGSNYVTVDNAKIALGLTSGTNLWRKITIARTDLSAEDKVTEQAVKHSLF